MRLTCSTIVLFLAASLGATPTADEQASRAVLFSSENPLVVEVRLSVIEQGRVTKTRTLELLSEREQETSRLLVRVLSPASLRSLKFLRVQGPQSTGTWVKTSRGLQRLAASDDPEPLFASDFTTADFLPSNEGWTRAPLEESLVLERKVTGNRGWVTQRMTLRPNDLLVLSCDYLDTDGNLVRKYEVTEFDATGMPVRLVLHDLKNRSSSELQLLKRGTSPRIEAGTFNPGNL